MNDFNITDIERLRFFQRRFLQAKEKYRESNAGRYAVEGWKNEFKNVLEKDFPDKVGEYNTITLFRTFNLKENESEFDNFMRENGEAYERFIENLIKEVEDKETSKENTK